MDKRGIGIFLVVVTGVSAAVQALYSYPDLLGLVGVRMPGFPFNLALVWIPALAAFLAAGLGGDREHPILALWPVPLKPALAAVVIVPVVFAVLNVVAALAHWAVVDRSIALFVAQMPEHLSPWQWSGGQRGALFAFGLILSMLLGPTLFALLWLGSEIGWRDYLYPKLLPLGRVRAALLSGALWGLWMAWLGVLPTDSGAPYPLLRYVLWGMAVGTVLAEARLRTRSVGLTAVVFGCYFAQVSGVWPYLFVPQGHSPFAGHTGIVSIAAWAVVAAVLASRPLRND